MDLSLYPHAMAMSAKEFIDWSTNVMDDIARASGAKKALDKVTDPFFNWGVRNAIYPLHFGIACCALEMAAASGPRFDTERYGMVFRSSPVNRMYCLSTDGSPISSDRPCAVFTKKCQSRSGSWPWASAPFPADLGMIHIMSFRAWTHSYLSISTSLVALRGQKP